MPAPDPLKAGIEVLTERVKSARVIARALIEREYLLKKEQLPMTPKLQALSSKLRDVVTAVEKRADGLITRLEKADEFSADLGHKLHAEIDKIEAAAKGVEDLVAQVSNGGPALDH